MKNLTIKNVNIGDHSVLRYFEIGLVIFQLYSVAMVELQVVQKENEKKITLEKGTALSKAKTLSPLEKKN